MINRRNVIPSLLGVVVPSVALATYKTPPKKECNCDCKDGEKGDPGDKGEKGDKGDKGEPGTCNCKHEFRTVHADFEISILGLDIPQPSIIVNTPNNTPLNDELWYFPQWNACIFFDYALPVPHFITFYRGGELDSWDKVTPMGIRVWNWHKQNPATGRNHVCTVSLDKILANTNKIIHPWTPITPYLTFGNY